MTETLFEAVLRMSLSGSLLILTAAAVRSLALHRLPRRTFPALWGLALFRLLLPLSLPSPFGTPTPGDLLQNRLADASGLALSPARAAGSLPTVGETVIPVPEAVAAPSVPELLGYVWLVGLLACAGYLVFTHLRCRREYRTALPAEGEYIRRWEREHPLRRRLRIMQSDRAAVPLTYGLLRPVILLPKTIVREGGERLDVVLAHELSHIRRFDLAKKLLLAVALCVHWFNPLVWLMFYLGNRDIELCCDEAAIRSLGDRMKAPYALTLLGLAHEHSRPAPLANCFGKNAVEERISAIMKMKRSTLTGLLAALALVVGAAALFATSAGLNPGTGTSGEFRLSYRGESLGLGDRTPAFLGEPAETRESTDNLLLPGDFWRTDAFDGLLIEYYVSGGTEQAAFIEAASPEAATRRGISVGSTKKQVLEAYPEILAGDLADKAAVLWYDESYDDPQSDRLFFYFDLENRVSGLALERQSITNSDWVPVSYPKLTEELLRELSNGHRTGLFDPENVRNEFLDTVKPYANVKLVSEKDGGRIYRAELTENRDYSAIELLLERAAVTSGEDELKVWTVAAYRYVE